MWYTAKDIPKIQSLINLCAFNVLYLFYPPKKKVTKCSMSHNHLANLNT